MLRAADSQVTAIKPRAAILASSSTASLLVVAFFSIEFDLKMTHMKEKADLYRLREVIFTQKNPRGVSLNYLFCYTLNGSY